MKAKTTVISPLGTFESDETDLSPVQVDEIKKIYEQCYKLNFLYLQQKNKIVYIPEQVIRKSIIILDAS